MFHACVEMFHTVSESALRARKSIMRLGLLIALTTLIPLTICFDVVPLVVASHRLVKGLKDELESTKISHRHSGVQVTNMIKKLITQCSSDEYVIVDVPKLSYKDLNDYRADDWPFLSRYISMASSAIGLPFINDYIDLSYVENYIINTCDALPMIADPNDENSIDYIDVQTRVIRMDFPPMEDEEGERSWQRRQIDEAIRKIIRKLPSPHYTIILTSSERLMVDPRPASAFDKNGKKYGVFDAIVNSPHRQEEREFNQLYKKVEPQWNDDRHTNKRYLKNKLKDQVKFLDYDLWVKNEQLVVTIVLMIMTVFMVKLKKLFVSV